MFEEVFQPSQRPEVYLHGCGEFAVSINGFEFRCCGVLFAQQNLITSCCAQVALRALLQTGGGNTVSYKKINEAAGITVDRIRDHYRARCGEMPRNDSQMLPVGMSADMIHRVLRGMGMNFFHTDYSITADRCADRLAVEKLLAEDHEDNGIRAQRHLLFRRTSSVEEELAACRESFRQEYPYFQSVYMGIEGGYGALLEFRVDRENKNDYCESHILPLFGHNLEQDAWLPQTAFGYFGQKTVGDVRYLSSAQWVTQIIGHDDNFGQNFAFARHSIGGEHILRVWELAHEGVAYSGVNAERYAWQALSSVLVDISLDTQWLSSKNSNCWLERLVRSAIQIDSASKHIGSSDVCGSDIVLRTGYCDRKSYLEHLRKEYVDLDPRFEEGIPEQLWVTEISNPQLFCANRKKLGEVLLDAAPSDAELSDRESGRLQFLYGIRLPGLNCLYHWERGKFFYYPVEVRGLVANRKDAGTLAWEF